MKKLMMKTLFPLKKEIVSIPSIPMDISTHSPQNHSISIVQITIMSDNMTPNMANQKIGKTSFLRNTIPTKISLPRKISTSFLNEDLGTTLSNLPLGSNPPIARLILYRNKNKRIFRNLSMKIFVLDVFTHQNPLWPHLSSLSRRKMENFAPHKIIESLTI